MDVAGVGRQERSSTAERLFRRALGSQRLGRTDVRRETWVTARCDRGVCEISRDWLVEGAGRNAAGADGSPDSGRAE